MDSVLKVQLDGITSLLMHSDRTANPLDPKTKAHKKLTSVRKKTDEQLEAVLESEWLCALYYRDEIGVYLPTAMLRSALVSGGKLRKLGSTISRGTMFIDEMIPLTHDGPKNPEELYQYDNGRFVDVRSVVVQRARVPRCRPIFTKWSVKADLNYDADIVDKTDLLDSFQSAGRLIGIGDFRPQKNGPHGRFTVTEIAA